MFHPGLSKLRAAGFLIRLPSAGGNPWIQYMRDEMQPMVENAAIQLQVHTGIAFGRALLDWGGDFDDPVGDGLITINVLTDEEWNSTGCSAASVGCAGVVNASQGRVNSGHLALKASYVLEQLGKPNGAGRAELQTSIQHELGHTLNLTHDNSKWQGEWQTMHSSSPGNSGDYRSGDVNGLKYMAAGS